MKKTFTFLITILFALSLNAQLVGTWRMASQAGALGVGPFQGNTTWWSNSGLDVLIRDCYFDDTYVFSGDGTFSNVQDGATWLEQWQGVDPPSCGTPIAPHDGSNAATWVYDEGAGTITLTGVGAYLGLAKVVNGGELSNPADAPASITYLVEFNTGGDTMTIDINVGFGWWRFILTTQEPKPLLESDVQDNFEDDGWGTITNWNFQDPGLYPLPVVEDPVNENNHVADYNRSGSFQYTNAQFILDFRMDLNERNKFIMDVYFPSSNDYSGDLTPTAALKLQTSLLGADAYITQTEVKLTVTEFDEWVTLMFDFGAIADSINYDQVVVQLGGEGHWIPGQFYFDNLYLLNQYIDIVAPNGGETLYQGSAYDITWNANDISGNVALYLQQGDERDLTLITESTPVENGSYTWTVWSSIEPGDDFKIYVTNPEGIDDYSDDFFSIAENEVARVQVIHNSADLAAEVVDVWLDNTLLLDNFTFRTASPFIDAPAGEEFTIAIKGPDSTDPNDPIWSQNYTLTDGETYVLIANGIVSAEGYDPVKPFDIYVYPMGREMATDMNNTDVLVFHGSTDAPTVDVVEIGQGAGTIIDDFMYEDFAGYLELLTADYILDIRDETGMNSVATYAAPLETLGLDGAALVTVASGFLNPENNSNGPAFGLWVALPAGGELIELPVYEEELPAPVNLEGEVSMNYLDVILTWEAPGTTGGDTVELVYDNDVASGAYYWPGATMATHMSPTNDCQLLALKFWTSGVSEFNAEVYGWTGSEPGSMVHTLAATGVDQDWLEIDVSAEEIMFTTDFVVGFGSLDDQVSIGFDEDLDNGRSWDWDGSAWAAWNEAYLIRAIVLYPDGRTAEIGAGMSDGQITIAPDFEVAEHSKDYSQVVTVKPLENRNSRDAELLGYNVYRDDAMINTELVTETTYTDVEPPLGSHDYYVTAVYEIFGESDPSNVVTIVITDVNEISATSVNVYPNPSTGTFTIGVPEGTETIVNIMDLTGKSVYQSNVNATTTITLDERYKGIYLLNVYDTTNDTHVVKKLVIK